MSANFHQYFIIAFKGAAALAPLAAAGLFLRPMTLVQTSLAQIDRPKLARAAAVGDRPLFQKIARSMLRLSIFALSTKPACCRVCVVVSAQTGFGNKRQLSLILLPV